MSATETKNKRLYWGKVYRKLPALDLLAVQKTSYAAFLEEGIKGLLEGVTPISDFTGKNWELRLGRHLLGEPSRTPAAAAYKGLSYDFPLSVEMTLVNKRSGSEVKERVFLGDLPKMTEVGTFIINGIERAVVNQIVRSPGVFFSGEVDGASGRMLYKAEMRPLRGSWLEFEVGRSEVVSVRIDRRRKFAITTFLRALGLGTDEEIWAGFAGLNEEGRRFIQLTLEKDAAQSSSEALIEIYQKMRPGEPIILENATEFVHNMFFDERRYDLGWVGRFKVNKRLGLPADEQRETLRLEDVLATVRYLINLQAGVEGRIDDIDHLANRRIRQVGELVADNAFRIGLLRLERSVKEKMSLFSTEDKVGPGQLINARPMIAAINEFFRSNQLSTILDQTNPLSEIDNLRRVSVMGSGGISRERASFSIRDINASQYGRICPIRTPEGQNIGLVTYLSLYAQINKYGFLETPYLRVMNKRVTEEIVYMAADDEQDHYITHRGIKIDEKGNLLEDWVPVRFGGEFLEEKAEKVEYIDVVPWQVVGTSASLIPFLNHDMANRALLGTHMQCQAVPLVKPEAPLVGTGMEKMVAEAMQRVVRAGKDGKVSYVDGFKVVVKSGREEKTYPLFKFKRTNPYSTCFSQKPVVTVGDKVKKGDLLIDGPACDKGELALGRNLVIAYCSYDGLEYEDAIVISDRLIKEDVLTSISIDEHEAAIVETKLGPEELTRDIPNVGEGDLRNLAEDGIVVVGSEVEPNDILVGKIAPKGETELTAEERLLRAIFGEKAREVRDTSLRLPHGEHGTVIGVQILDRDKGDELEAGTIKKVLVRVAQLRRIGVGDKLAGRHGNKGVISKVVSAADMPYLPDGAPIDIIISPLSVLARMNLGQLLEAHLGWAAQKLGYKMALPVFDRIDEKRIAEELVRAGLPVNGKVKLVDGRTGEPHKTESVVGVAYILKLVHMVDDKMHARSTGPYSLITQQPLGGKAQMGGQRLGEMEVWALEAHRAAYTLQEMLTVKSDDVSGRARTFEAIVKGSEIPEAMVPESFNVLNRELNSLALEIIPTNKVEEEDEQAS
ncbi:MAG: DNA-directed RNA polymerase subunit beta [Candidatus Shapirobacteria bacterium]